MKKAPAIWFILGAVFLFLAGSGLHFLYEAAGQSYIAAIFGSVNESTWEHLKLLFWPLLLWGLAAYLSFGWRYKNFTAALALSMFAGMAAITILFYTYSGVLGYNLAPVDILTFAIGSAAAMYVCGKALSSNRGGSTAAEAASLIYFGALTVAFIRFTFAPPELGIFLPPVS